jgi:signal transduction histidine kinase
MDRCAEDAGVPARRRFRAGAAERQWLLTVVLTAGMGVLMLSTAARPGLLQRGPLILLLVCTPVIVLRRWPLLVLGVVAAALVVAVAYAALTPMYTNVATEMVDYFVPLAGAWFIADSVVARRRYQAGLAAQAERERAAEVRQERVRIAREMHDVVAHALAVITVQAGVGRCLAGQHPEKVTAAFGSIESIGRVAQDELRVVLGLLRDGEAGTAPLAPAPRLVDVRDLAETVRASGVQVEMRMEGLDRRLSPSLELSVYRVVQEALTNVVKHAPGARVVAELTVSAEKVSLDIRDDGGKGGQAAQGGHAAQAGPGTGHGIVGMRERIGAFGGRLVAGPADGGGFRVTAEVPAEGVAS